MQTQNVILRGYVHGAESSFQTSRTQSLPRLPTAFSPKIGISLQNHSFFRLGFLIANTNFRCKNSVEKTEYRGVPNVEDDRVEAKIRRKNLAVFVSGGGSNFRSIYEATLNGSVLGDVVALVTNKHDCGGAEYAREKGIPVIVFPKGKHTQEAFSAADLVISLRYSGPTIHYVDEHYDTGRILAQRAVPVLAKDTAEELAARVLHEEHRLYVEVCAALCEERIVWREDGVPLIRSKENPYDYC